MDGEEFSACFEDTREPRQEHVLSPLLFNIFFATALETVTVRLSEDDIILKDITYLDEEAVRGA